MANDYDKIFKENITAILLPLAEKVLGIDIKNSKPLKDKLQDTVEREADYLSVVEQNNGRKFILHLEFQTTSESNMVERMQLYYSLLRRKHNLPVVQKVLYFGSRPANMRTTLSSEEIFSGFELISLNQQSYKNFIDSNIPEELILTILTNFEDKDEVAIVKHVIRKLQETNQSEIAFKKYVKQLVVLSRLRGLNETIRTAIQKMPITYNIEEDSFYKEGLKRGLEKVKKEKELRQREKELRQREKEQAIIQMLNDGIPSEKIATYLNVSLPIVNDIAKKQSSN